MKDDTMMPCEYLHETKYEYTERGAIIRGSIVVTEDHGRYRVTQEDPDIGTVDEHSDGTWDTLASASGKADEWASKIRGDV